jgi:hypothetical protein
VPRLNGAQGRKTLRKSPARNGDFRHPIQTRNMGRLVEPGDNTEWIFDG